MAGNTEIVKGIVQLEVDYKELEAGLKAVAGQYAKVSTEVNAQNEALKKLTDQEKKLLEARAATNNPTFVVKYDEKLKEVRANIEAVNKETLNTAKAEKIAGQEADKLGQKMSKAFSTTVVTATTNAVKDTEKEINNLGKAATKSGGEVGKEGAKAVNAFQKLRTELKAAKGELAEAIAGGNADAIDAASQKVGALKDQFNDLNESANAFASGSKFQQIGNLLGDVGANIFALDFGRANEQSKVLLKTTKSLSFKEAVAGVKDLGSTFVNIGKSLLLNPIFLIGALITVIVAKFDALREAGGLIGTIFNGIGKAIGVVIDAGKDLLDFLGIIDSTRKSLEQLIDQQETLIKTTENYFNRAIALRKAANQSTIQLENEKADAVNKALLKELNDTKERLLEKASSYEDYYELQKKLIDIGLRASQVATEKEVRNIEVEKQARLKLLALQQDITREKNAAAEVGIELKLDPDSPKKIKAQFDLQRKALREQAAEEKRQAEIDFVDYDGGKAAKAKIDAKYAVINKKLRQEESKAQFEAQKKLGEERIELAKNTEELLLDIAQSQGALTEVEVAEEKVVILAKYYNDKLKLAEDNIAKEKKLGFTTIESEKELLQLRKEGEAGVIKAQDDLSKKRKQLNLENLDEEKRHSLAMLSIYNERKLRFFEVENDRRLIEIKKEIEFEEEKLRILKASGEATTEELKKQQNTTDELKAKADAIAKKAEQEKIEGVIDGIFATVAATIAATNAIVQTYADRNDKLASLQQKRIEDAKNIADKGNAELLELEEKRLEDLNKKREQFVRVQQSLAAVEMVANAGVAITKAAMEGGVAAPFTIATTIIALVAGLAQARAIASQAAFYEGGLFEGQGYTGDGNARQESLAVGQKPYTYHKKEFIFNHQNTHKYRDIFEDVHKGKVDLNDWRDKVKLFESMNKAQGMQLAGVMFPAQNEDMSDVKKQLEILTKVVKNQSMFINFDDQGFTARMTNIKAQSDFIKNTLAKP